jgi:hypothetical protein
MKVPEKASGTFDLRFMCPFAMARDRGRAKRWRGSSSRHRPEYSRAARAHNRAPPKIAGAKNDC